VRLAFLPEYEHLDRITSDCNIWPNGGSLLVCEDCLCLQKRIDDGWRAEISEIYQAYSIYHQGAGAEQPVFDQGSGAATSRSLQLIRRLQEEVGLAAAGRLLDVGCGNGSLLRVFSQLFPGWSLMGTELNDKYASEVRGIRGVESLQVGGPHLVPGEFDLITMVHVLEHVPDPIGFLRGLLGKLRTDGLLMIEVPNFLRNPFDLLIADHCTHYTEGSLRMVVEKAGFQVVLSACDWVSKELTLVAKAGSTALLQPQLDFPLALTRAVAQLDWLDRVRIFATRGDRMSGIFGTSIAATWICHCAQGKFQFFVDEDVNRVGKTYQGLPVWHPKEAPCGAEIFVPVPADVGESLLVRLESSFTDCTFVMAPALAR
jgi:SAM-dependent methyltransferase